MKTPDEFKKNLIVCMDEAIEVAENGDAHDLLDFAHHAHARMSETLTIIQQHEANWQQVSKALCGKENATLEELLQAVDQVKQNKPVKKLICEITVDGEDIRKALEEMVQDGKTIIERLEPTKGCQQLETEIVTVRRERDAAVADLVLCGICKVCKHVETKCNGCSRCKLRVAFCDKFEWRGVCTENTEVQEDG